MKRKTKLILKQSIKYLTILLVFSFGISLWRLMWTIPDGAFFWFVGVVVMALIVMGIFDAVSLKDILPIFKN